VESPATRQLLKKMGRGDFEHLVVASSIIRPAANEYIREFVERLKGKPYTIHPLLRKALRETHGIMVYQEDVSRVAMALAGFSAGEADRLRKAILKKDDDNQMKLLAERFLRGARLRRVTEHDANRIWRMIRSFHEYSFCKAHSASYALLSCKLAYLKRYYTLEFMTSVINNEGGFYSRQTYLNESKRKGIRILCPDINRSEILFTPVGEGTMRAGLGQIRQLEEGFVRRILSARKRGGDFDDLSDFVRRCSPGLEQMRALILSGTLDSLSGGVSRPALFWQFFQIARRGDLFHLPQVPPFIEDYSRDMKLADEVKTLGVLISIHPLDLYRQKIASLDGRASGRLAGEFEEGKTAEAAAAEVEGCPVICSRDLPRFRNRRVCIPGLFVTGKEVRTKGNDRMVFLSFEDSFSVFETVLFPRVFRRVRPILYGTGAFLITGRVDQDQGAFSITVDGLRRVS
jgi:DNA polymerase III alpha subunit